MKFSAQEPGMAISGATHLALILFGLVALAAPKPFDEFAEATPVDVISESQFHEITKGDLKEKQFIANAPRRVDRVAKTEEDNDPGAEKTNVPTPPPPPLRPDVKQAEEELDSIAVPAPTVPKVAKVEPPAALPPARPVEPPKPAPKPEPKPVASKPAPAKATSTDEEEDEDDAEIIKQRQKKLEAEKAAEARKAEEAKKEEARKEEARREQARERAEREKEEAIRKAAEAQKIEDQKRKTEEARKLAEKRELERQARLAREEERKEAEEEKAEEARKAAEAQKLAEARQRQIDEQKKKAAEAARKQAEARKAEEARKAAEKAETDKLNAAIRNRLLASRDAPAASGSTGQQVTRTASAGAPNATGQKLSPSEKGELARLISEQMNRCWSVTTTTVPAVKPMVRLQLGPNGAIIAAPVLVNRGDSSFQAVADSGMRAIRQCSPYRIPAKFAEKYQDWKNVTVQLDPSDLL